MRPLAEHHQPSILEHKLLLFASAKRMRPVTEHHQHPILQHNLVLFTSAKANATSGRASSTFHFTTQALLFASVKSVCDRWQSWQIDNVMSDNYHHSSSHSVHASHPSFIPPTTTTINCYQPQTSTQSQCHG
jgi:hypothetical protein